MRKCGGAIFNRVSGRLRQFSSNQEIDMSAEEVWQWAHALGIHLVMHPITQMDGRMAYQRLSHGTS